MMPLNTVSRWLLLGSLVLNAFLGGILVGHFDHRPGGPHGPSNPAEMAERMAQDLAPSDAAILRAAFAIHAASFAHADQKAHAFPDRIGTVLAAEPFDPETLKQVLEEIRLAHQDMDDAMTASILDAAGRMSPEGRKKLALTRPPHP